jgi:proline dehydrogenase
LNLISKLGLRFARQWVAGADATDAIEQVRRLNGLGLGGILNFLGENVNTVEMVEEHVSEYRELIDNIVDQKVEGCISLKLTQIGLDVSDGLCSSKLEEILSLSDEKKVFVWFDMESSAYTGKIIDTYLHYFKRYNALGLAVQAYLKRTEKDLMRILDSDGIVRLVKGAYKERSDVICRSRSEVTARFSKFVKILFDRAEYFALATHDSRLCLEAVQLSKKCGKKPEFQFLMGIRNSLKRELAKDGYRTLDYVPYGQNWFPYVLRRLNEKPSNILLMVRSLFE